MLSIPFGCIDSLILHEQIVFSKLHQHSPQGSGNHVEKHCTEGTFNTNIPEEEWHENFERPESWPKIDPIKGPSDYVTS